MNDRREGARSKECEVEVEGREQDEEEDRMRSDDEEEEEEARSMVTKVDWVAQGRRWRIGHEVDEARRRESRAHTPQSALTTEPSVSLRTSPDPNA